MQAWRFLSLPVLCNLGLLFSEPPLILTLSLQCQLMMWMSTLKPQLMTTNMPASRRRRSSWRSGTTTAWTGWALVICAALHSCCLCFSGQIDGELTSFQVASLPCVSCRMSSLWQLDFHFFRASGGRIQWGHLACCSEGWSARFKPHSNSVVPSEPSQAVQGSACEGKLARKDQMCIYALLMCSVLFLSRWKRNGRKQNTKP